MALMQFAVTQKNDAAINNSARREALAKSNLHLFAQLLEISMKEAGR